MNIEEIYQIFQELITQGDKLQNGQNILNDLVNKVPNFCTFTYKLVTSNELDSNYRKLVAYIMKNVLKDHWKTNPLLESEKQVSLIPFHLISFTP